MKKTAIIAIISLIMVFLLFGCSKPQDNNALSSSQAAQPQQPAAQSAVQQPASEQQPASQSQPSQGIASAGTAEITMKDFSFNPVSLTIKAGTTVRWTNEDPNRHSVMFDSFKSSLLDKGQTYGHRFDEKGVYGYSCGVHPSMKGQIIVQ